MTILAWLQSRIPAPPPAILARVVEALGDRAGRNVADAPTVCLDAATELLEELLREDSIGRDRAGELLAADALVTYAFESAASLSPELDDFAERTMTRLAALAPPEASGRTRE